MLQGLRQHGFMLNGCLAALLLVSLLLSALAPCLAAAPDAPQAAVAHQKSHNMSGMDMSGMDMAHGMADMDGHCPHCEVATTPCMASAVDCSAQPAALFKTPETERQIEKPLAVMSQVFELPTAARATIVAEYPTVQPCVLSGRDRRVLFCSFQE